MSKRNVTESVKKAVAGKQNYKCSNIPSKPTIYNFNCPLYNNYERKGSFGEEGYEIDHIVELCNGGSNEINNLQALCLSCHRVKTKRLLQQKRNKKNEEETLFLVEEYDNDEMCDE